MTGGTVNLFLPCLVDQLYPELGWATVHLLEYLGFVVDYEPAAVCCGQPAFNAGHATQARAVARNFIACQKAGGDLVCPSGSCTSMVKRFYPVLFEGEPDETSARAVGPRAFELSQFILVHQLQERIQGKASGRVAFHNSCHSCTELGIGTEPQALLERVSGITLVPSPPQACCGFGGMFATKFPSIAGGMAQSRLESFLSLDIDVLVSNDPGCILHMRQHCRERGIELNIVHLAEFLCQALELS